LMEESVSLKGPNEFLLRFLTLTLAAKGSLCF
jgi:hypothetical protein